MWPDYTEDSKIHSWFYKDVKKDQQHNSPPFQIWQDRDFQMFENNKQKRKVDVTVFILKCIASLFLNHQVNEVLHSSPVFMV